MIAVRCTVRGCGATIPAVAAANRRAARDSGVSVLRGPCGHSFDIARSGYISLLQPQDRRSLEAGDSRETAAARRELLDSGFGDALRLLRPEPQLHGGIAVLFAAKHIQHIARPQPDYGTRS